MHKVYYNILSSYFDFLTIDSFCDISIKPNIPIDSSIQNLNKSIKFKKINGLSDLSSHIDTIQANKKYDMVSCSVSLEELQLGLKNNFFESLAKVSRDITIVNCMFDHDTKSSKTVERYLHQGMTKNGFDFWNEAGNDLQKEFNDYTNILGGANILVFRKRRFLELHSKRFIQGCSNDDFTYDMKKTYAGTSLQRQLLLMKDKILFSVENKQPLSILRLGDGDIYFVNSIASGSAKPGSRALTIEYHKKNNLAECRRGMYQPDIITTQINSLAYGGMYLMLLMEFFYKIFPNFHTSYIAKRWVFMRFFYRGVRYSSIILRYKYSRIIAYPILFLSRFKLGISHNKYPIIKPFAFNLETVYALIASRLIFRMFPSGILIVGQQEKVDAINILSGYKQYRDYLGIKSFCGYVGVSKIGAADNESLVISKIKAECKKNAPKVILLGIGSSKMYVLPRIQEFSNAVVIDVGAGIDALAGVVSQDRPYFSDWVNYKSDKIDYDSMNIMDHENPNRDNDKYNKIILDGNENDW
jgi:hypothetical protein